MSDSTLSERLHAYLQQHNVVTLATTGPHGPWAAPVFFASEGFTLFFISSPTTRHGQEIGNGNRVAAVITTDHRDWQAIDGIQLQGTCCPVGPDQTEQALNLFVTKFPFARSFLDPSGPMYERAGKKVIFYRLDAQVLWFTDNAKGFGHRERFDVPT